MINEILYLLVLIEFFLYLSIVQKCRKFVINKSIQLKTMDLAYFIFTKRVSQFGDSYEKNKAIIDIFIKENHFFVSAEKYVRISIIIVGLYLFANKLG